MTLIVRQRGAATALAIFLIPMVANAQESTEPIITPNSNSIPKIDNYTNIIEMKKETKSFDNSNPSTSTSSCKF